MNQERDLLQMNNGYGKHCLFYQISGSTKKNILCAKIQNNNMGYVWMIHQIVDLFLIPLFHTSIMAHCTIAPPFIHPPALLSSDTQPPRGSHVSRVVNFHLEDWWFSFQIHAGRCPSVKPRAPKLFPVFSTVSLSLLSF